MTKTDSRQPNSKGFVQAWNELIALAQDETLSQKAFFLWQYLCTWPPSKTVYRQQLVPIKNKNLIAGITRNNLKNFIKELQLFNLVEVIDSPQGVSYRAVRDRKLFRLPITESPNHESVTPVTESLNRASVVTESPVSSHRSVTLCNTGNTSKINTLTLLNQKGMINEYFKFTEKNSRLKPHLERWIEIASDEIDFRYMVQTAAKSYQAEHRSKHNCETIEPIRATNSKFLDIVTGRITAPFAWENFKKQFPNPFSAVDEKSPMDRLDEALAKVDDDAQYFPMDE